MVTGGYVKGDYAESDNERKHPQILQRAQFHCQYSPCQHQEANHSTLTYTQEYQRTGTGTTLVVFKERGLWRLATLCTGLHRNHLCHTLTIQQLLSSSLTYIHHIHLASPINTHLYCKYHMLLPWLRLETASADMYTPLDEWMSKFYGGDFLIVWMALCAQWANVKWGSCRKVILGWCLCRHTTSQNKINTSK